MENFYLCSHLPIKQFDLNGYEISSIGHSASTEALFYHYLSPALMKEYATSLHTQIYINITLSAETSFTLCRLKRDDFKDGFFVIGPYTTVVALKEHTLFRPSHCVSHLIELLYAISHSKEASVPSYSKTYNYHVNQAEQYIKEHFKENITLDEVSDYLAIHKSYFCTIFKEHTGLSFSNYLNRLRIEKSKELLTTTSNSILDIALSVGFSSANYFNTQFKKYTHQTPLQYRHQQPFHP